MIPTTIREGRPVAGSPWSSIGRGFFTQPELDAMHKVGENLMNKEQQSVYDFHAKYGSLINTKPTIPDLKTLILRARLICEEAAEFLAAASKEDIVEMADSLADILYVVYGTAVTLGINLAPIFAEVQRSKMTKDGGGKDSGGKIVKGPNYDPPNIKKELEKQGLNTCCKSLKIKDQCSSEFIAPLDRPSWDVWFLSLCHLVSMRSHDPDTKHGAILCDKNHRILGVGYNGYPRGSNDSIMPTTRPDKYSVTIHAESNCILNSQNLLLGENYTMYVTGVPCPNCFIMMVQAGVKKIIHSQTQSKCVDLSKVELIHSLAKTYGVEIINFEATDAIKKLISRIPI